MTAIMNGIALHGGFDPVRRHVPGVLGLRAQRRAHGRADETARDPRLHARFDRPRRGRSDAPADRAPREPAAHARTCASGVPATPPRPRSHGRDAVERRDGPTASSSRGRRCRSRRATPRSSRRFARGGYVLVEPDGEPECVVIATGSEVGLALDAARDAGNARPPRAGRLDALHRLFDAQDESYRDSVLPPGRAARRGRGWRARGLVALRRQRRRACSA